MQMPMCATWAPKHCILSSLSSLQGTRFEIAANAQYNNHGSCGCATRRSSRGVAFAAAGNKQKKKGKEKRKSPGGTLGRGWSFDQLMLVWDDVFEKVCEDTELVAKMRTLGQNGLERYGSGCVLLQEFVRTLPRGSASGFSNHSRRSSSKDTDEPPAYSTLSSTIEYVPRTFVNDPSLAPEEIPSTPDRTNPNGAYVVDVTAQVIPDFPLVKKGNLISLLRGMDRTRILGLTADESSTVVAENESATPAAVDAGGEKPYNPRNEELVLMLAVIVDNQPAVGADIIRAIPTGTKSEDGEELWKFEVKDFHTLPIP